MSGCCLSIEVRDIVHIYISQARPSLLFHLIIFLCNCVMQIAGWAGAGVAGEVNWKPFVVRGLRAQLKHNEAPTNTSLVWAGDQFR